MASHTNKRRQRNLDALQRSGKIKSWTKVEGNRYVIEHFLGTKEMNTHQLDAFLLGARIQRYEPEARPADWGALRQEAVEAYRHVGLDRHDAVTAAASLARSVGWHAIRQGWGLAQVCGDLRARIDALRSGGDEWVNLPLVDDQGEKAPPEWTAS